MYQEPKFIQDRFDIERRAWDYYGFAWTRILEQITHEKYQRKHELTVIDRRKQKLVEWRKKLDEKTKQLKVFEPYLSLARKLLEMKLTLDDIGPWIEIIREKAEAEKIDVRSEPTQHGADVTWSTSGMKTDQLHT